MMSILVVVEQDNEETQRHRTGRAQAIGGDIDALVAGHGCGDAASAAAAIAGITKVIVADATENAHGLAENIAP